MDASDPAGYRGHYEPVTFDGSAGDAVTAGLMSAADPCVLLLAPDGRAVAGDDDGHLGFYSAIDEYALSASGEYAIVATGYDESATFAYDLSLTRVE